MSFARFPGTLFGDHFRLIAGVGLGAAVLLVAVALGRAYLELQQPMNGPALGSDGSVRAIPDLASLVRQSDLVVVGRVTDDGTTHLQAQPVATPVVHPPPASPDGPSVKVVRDAPPPPPAALGQAGAARQPQMLVTNYAVVIEQVLRGASAVGQQITLVQPGGVLSAAIFPGGPALTRTVQVEADPLMRANARYVFFLRRGEAGTWYVVGGSQGRMSIDARNNVHPLNPSAPATHAYDGDSLERFVSAVARIG
ncbi:MAG: hypothetical protein JOZ81_11480 [Chloroflexi bacterium]|nr:hypothetical protein [Chloroflexota bacterium]